MLCESCRAGDPECNAWIACERQVSQMSKVMTPQRDEAPLGNGCRCGGDLIAVVGFDEDDPYTEPRMVLVCEVHP